MVPKILIPEVSESPTSRITVSHINHSSTIAIIIVINFVSERKQLRSPKNEQFNRQNVTKSKNTLEQNPKRLIKIVAKTQLYNDHLKNRSRAVNNSGASKICTIKIFRWLAAVLSDRAFSRQKMRNLTDNLTKTSNKIYSEAVTGQFQTLFRKRTDIPQFF